MRPQLTSTAPRRRLHVSDPREFYDELADAYHLIFEDWERSRERQAQALAGILRRWPSDTAPIVDVAAGIGTQTIGLAALGFEVVASDISLRALQRARREADAADITVPFAAADFRALPFRTDCAAVALACDNALPHLMSQLEITSALGELVRCVRPGGGIVISVRDYTPQPTGTRQVIPYGEREWRGGRYFAEQEWEWHGRTYELTLRIRRLDTESEPIVNVRTRYFAVSIRELSDLMWAAGLADVERIDHVFYQPLLVGTVPSTA